MTEDQEQCPRCFFSVEKGKDTCKAVCGNCGLHIKDCSDLA